MTLHIPQTNVAAAFVEHFGVGDPNFKQSTIRRAARGASNCEKGRTLRFVQCCVTPCQLHRFPNRSVDMGWEKRDRGGLYYTRTRKVGGRVVREYVGGGTLGHTAALQDVQERRRREGEAALWNEERERLEALVAPVEELYEAAETLYRAALLSAGFRRHQRGEWRRKREPKE
jgi:hypothetical protein